MNSEKDNLVQVIHEIADQLEKIDGNNIISTDMAILKERTVDLLIEVSRVFSRQKYAAVFARAQQLLESIRSELQSKQRK